MCLNPSILDETEGVRPEVELIPSLIAEHDAVLATGHLSPEESLTLLKMAQRCSVKRMGCLLRR